MPFIAPSRRAARSSLSPANAPSGTASSALPDDLLREQPAPLQSPPSVFTQLGESSFDTDGLSPTSAAAHKAAAAFDDAYLPSDIALLFQPSSTASAPPPSNTDSDVSAEALARALLQVSRVARSPATSTFTKLILF